MIKHIIYLASGSSSRFGSENKLFYEIDGKPMYLHGMEMLKGLLLSREDCTLTVVSRYPEIRQKAAEMDLFSVDSPDSDKGMSYTIKAAFRTFASIEAEDFLVFVVADQPWLTAASVEKLLAEAKDGTVGASLCWGDRPGNPTLFSAELLPELLALEGDQGGRKVLKQHPCIFVQACSEKELEDIDTKA